MSEAIFLSAQPRSPANAAATSVLLAGGGQDRPYRHPVTGAQHRAGLIRRPLFSAQLGFGEDGWTGSTTPQTTAVSFSTADPLLAAQLAGLVWKSAPVTIEAGAEGSAPVTILKGLVKDAEFTRAGMTLTIVDLSESLGKPIVSARFAGTGGIEGLEEAKGRPKRRTFGYVFNVEGRLIDAANSIYEFGDPAFGFSAWTALRDKGREGSFTEIAWQGSVAATLAALKASNPARGGGVVARSIACAKWWTQPSGPLTADFIGTGGTGGAMQAAAIADRISQAAGGPPVSGLAAANALRGGNAGLHIASDQETAAQAIDRLLLGVSLLWLPLPDGTIAIREWAFGNPATPFKAEFRGRSRTYPPHATRRVGFQRNERIHSNAEIAGILLEELTDAGAALGREDLLNSEQKWSEVQDDGGRPEDDATRNQARGNYSGSATYLPGDMVVWTVASGGDGAGYTRIGTGATTGVAPSDASKWALTVQRGAPGPPGGSGAPATSAFLTNEAVTLGAYADGTIVSYSPANGYFKVFAGSTDISDSFELSTISNPQGLIHGYNGRQFFVSGGFDPGEDFATLAIRATGSGAYSGVTFDKVFTIAKAKGGYEIVASAPTSGNFEGRQIWNEATDRLEVYRGGSWRPVIDVDSAIDGAQLDERTVTIEKLLVSPGNLVQNHKFSTGDLSGWRQSTNPQYQSVVNSAIAPSNFVLRFNHPGSGTVSSAIFAAENARSDPGSENGGFAVEPGKQYHVRVNARAPSAFNGRFRVSAFFLGTDGSDNTNLDIISTTSIPSDWALSELTGNFTAPVGTVRCWIFVQIDNWTADRIDVTNLWVRRRTDADLIVDGGIIARTVAANAITGDKLAVGSVTAAKANITELSAISGNLGTIIAGMIRDAANRTRFDVNNGRIEFRRNGFMKVTGVGFGTSNQFIEWYGPEKSSVNQCDDASALWALGTDGTVFGKGTFESADNFYTASTTSTSSTASADTGNFSATGADRIVSVAYSYDQYGTYTGGSGGGSSSSSTATIRIEKSVNSGSSWTTIATFAANGSESYYCDPEIAPTCEFSRNISGSQTNTDTSGSTGTIRYRARLLSRTLAGNGSGGTINQSLAITVQETN